MKNLQGALAYCHNAITAPDERWSDTACLAERLGQGVQMCAGHAAQTTGVAIRL